MTPKEKEKEAKLLFDILRRVGDNWIDNNHRLLKKRKTFPFSQQINKKFVNFGEWNITLTFNSRPKMKRGVTFYLNAWQKFFINRSNKVENIGAGVYLIGGSPGGGVGFSEFTPHFFNRFKERYFQRHNITADFLTMVEELKNSISLSLKCNSSKLIERYNPCNKKSSLVDIPHYEGYENFCIFIPQGLCLGIEKNDNYYCFLTFIGKEELFKNQSELYRKAEHVMKISQLMKDNDPLHRDFGVEEVYNFVKKQLEKRKAEEN